MIELELLKEFADVLTIDDIKKILKIGRNKSYNLLKNGTIKSFKIGRSYRVCKKDLIIFIQKEQ